MKHLILITFLIFSFSTKVFSQENYTIKVEFTNFKSDKGNVFITLYNKKEDFLKVPFKTKIAKIINQKATVIFKGISPKEYTISAFHDENNNKKMDTKLFGIPKEPVGISNNAKGFFGPPKYEDAKFTVNKNTTLKIKME